MEEIFSGLSGSGLLLYCTVIVVIPVNINFSLWPRHHQTFQEILHLNKTDFFLVQISLSKHNPNSFNKPVSGAALYGCKGTGVFSFVLLSCTDMVLLSEDL